MDILFYGLTDQGEFDQKREEEIKKYTNSTLLDAALNITIRYMRKNAEELDPLDDKSVTEADYKQRLDEYVYEAFMKLRCFEEIVGQILKFYQDNQVHIDKNTPLLTLFRTHALGSENERKILNFLEHSGYIEFQCLNRDNYSTLVNYSSIISRLEEEMMQLRNEFAEQPFAAKTELKLNDKITVTVKSSAKRCFMALLRCVKQVRQIRWLAWFEDYLYLLLTAATASVSPHYKYIVLLPEFFFVDIYDNPVPPKTDVRGYVKPFYEDVARYFAGLHTEYPVHEFIEESLHQNRIKDLTALYPNMIIFAGTMVWKTKTKRAVYTDGQEVITRRKWKFKKVETDTFFNTAVVFLDGHCRYLWDKQFISSIDGQGGVKVIHRHETPSSSDLHYIKSSMSIEMGMLTPVMKWASGGENITFLISICRDFMELSEQNYDPQPDIHILSAAGSGHFGKCAKGKYFLLVCDAAYSPASFCFNLITREKYQGEKVLDFCRFFIQIPDQPEKAVRPVAFPANSENSFYEKVLKEGLIYHDLTESAAFEADREEDFIFIDNSVVTEVKITSAGEQSAEGTLVVMEGEDVFSYPVTVFPSIDLETHEPRIELSLQEKENRSFSLSEILLFSGNMSEGFLNAISLPLGVPKECKFYFYENGRRTYHLSFQYNMEIPLICDLLILKDACIDVIRSDDIYQYTLSSVVDIAGCAIEFGVVSGSLDLVQAYFKPALDEQSFPSFAQFAEWALGGQIEDFKNLADFKLLDLALVSVKAYIRTKEQIAFDEIVVTTRLTLFSLVFSVSVSVIGKCLLGSLEIGQEKKSVSEIICSMFLSGQTPSIPKGLASLYIEQAGLYADIKENSYQVSFQISGVWEEGQISLDSLKMFFASGQGEQKVSFEGKLTLFETLAVQVGVIETNGVWSAQGGVFIPEEKSLMDLFSSFGWEAPQIFKRISLQYVNLTATPEMGDFQFECAAGLMLETLSMQFLITACKSEEEVSYSGEMSFEKAGEEAFPFHFLVSFEDGQGKETLSLEWKQDMEFCITDFCRMLGFEEFELPEFLDISIADLHGSFDFGSKEFVFLARTTDQNMLYIRSGLSGQNRQVIFGIGLGMEISLAKLPVVGDSSPLMKEVGLRGLKTLILSSDCSHLTIEPLDIADGDFHRGVHLFSELYLSDTTVPLNLSIGGKEKKNLLKTETCDNAEEADRVSIRIDKHIGPVSIQKIGMSYSDQSLNFMFDSGFSQGSLMFSLEDLGIRYQIAEKKPSFFLKGLSVLVKSDVFSIGGSFLMADPNTYRGSLIIGLKSFQLAA